MPKAVRYLELLGRLLSGIPLPVTLEFSFKFYVGEPYGPSAGGKEITC